MKNIQIKCDINVIKSLLFNESGLSDYFDWTSLECSGEKWDLESI